jgi:hypothetical protein
LGENQNVSHGNGQESRAGSRSPHRPLEGSPGHETRPISAISTPQAGRGHSTPSASKAIANHNEQLEEINGNYAIYRLLPSARKRGMRMNLASAIYRVARKFPLKIMFNEQNLPSSHDPNIS